MVIIKQLFWILFFSFLGEIGSYLSPVAVPGSVIGMILLFFALHFKWIEMEKVEAVGEWLTNNMAILFIPAGVGLMTNFSIIGDVWWQLLLVVLISTLAMMALVGVVVQSVIRMTVKENLEESYQR
ncbi:CidA/LrgA family protein [Alkalibacterium sp. f15]|uniref:CidA/LrgA family protein n=1 Tax=Alkalibacterium sp. f15 TaxID=3414029 RepID=UPI003BF84E15